MARKKERLPQKTNPEPAPPRPSKPPLDWRPHLFPVLAILAVTLAAYANSFTGQLSFDNKVIVEDDPRIRAVTADNLGRIWSKGYWFDNRDSELYRPVTTLTYLFNYAILGNGPWPPAYHWVNFILHAINALLVYCLGLVIFGDRARAAALAALWAVHPVLTESVTNIVGRADLLAAMAVLVGLLCHVKAVAAIGKRRLAWLAGLAAASAIGMFSKESAVALVPLILVYDLAYRRKQMAASMASYAAVALPLAAFLLRRWQVIRTVPLDTTGFLNNPLIGIGFWHARLTAIQVIGRYLGLMLWPARLSCDYSFNQIPLFHGTLDGWGDWAALIGLALCLAAAAWAVTAWRRRQPPFFFLLLFFLALAPVANIAILVGTVMAERFLYLPAVGFIGCMVWAIWAGAARLRAKWPSAAKPVWLAGALCLCLVIRTEARNSDWASELSLFASAARVSASSYKTHLNLAVLLLADPAKLDRAIAEGERTLAILATVPPGQFADASPYASVATIYRTKGDAIAKEASAGAAQASAVWYRNALAVVLQGVAADRRFAEDFARKDAAAGRPPAIYGFAPVYGELGVIYQRLGEPGKALEALDEAISIQPSAKLFQLESDSYAALDDWNSAAITLMEGVLMYPDEKAFPSELLAHYQKEPGGCAVEKAGSNNSLNLGCKEVHDHLCAGARRVKELYDRRGEHGKAAKAALMAAQSLGCPAQ